MNRTLILFLLVAAVAAWTSETVDRERLTRRLDVMRLNTRAAGRVQAEHERLRRAQPFAGEIESLRRDRVELAGLRRDLAQRRLAGPASDRAAARAAVGREILPMALWLPTELMPDLGRSTPHAALQTALWAAGAGQVHALKEVLTFDPAGREAALEVIARLPASLRLEYSQPELLVAGAMAKRHPAEEIQLVAEQLVGFDEAIEFVAVKSAGREPRTIHLRLRWEPGGWRLVVPAHVVENAARELTGAAPRPPPDPWHDAPRSPEP
jgi:hypothetical protein